MRSPAAARYAKELHCVVGSYVVWAYLVCHVLLFYRSFIGRSPDLSQKSFWYSTVHSGKVCLADLYITQNAKRRKFSCRTESKLTYLAGAQTSAGLT